MPKLQFLVLDEADRTLQSEFAQAVQEIIKILNEQKENSPIKNDHRRQTLLFSATMTRKVERLEKASLHDPVKLQVLRAFPPFSPSFFLSKRKNKK